MEKVEKRLSKLQVLLTDSELATIDDWRFDNRAENRSSAVRELIALGLKLCEADRERVREILAEIRSS